MKMLQKKVSHLLHDIKDDKLPDEILFFDICKMFGDHGIVLTALFLATPCAIPFLYGVPQIVSVPLFFVTLSIILGHEKLWLPYPLMSRRLSKASFLSILAHARPQLERLGRLSRPRLHSFTSSPMRNLAGLVMTLSAVSIALPFPMTNTVPAVGIMVSSFGLLERDGLFVLLGSLISMIWLGALVSAGSGLMAFAVAQIG